MHGAKGGGVGDCCGQFLQGHTLADEGEHVVEGLAGLTVEDLFGKVAVTTPVAQASGAGRDGLVELQVNAGKKDGEVDGMAPAGALLHASRAGQAGNDRGENLFGVLPADVVEQLEGLVGEVESMARIEEEVVRAGGEDHLGDGGRGKAEVDGGAERAFGRLRGARLDEAPEPLQVAGGGREAPSPAGRGRSSGAGSRSSGRRGRRRGRRRGGGPPPGGRGGHWPWR